MLGGRRQVGKMKGWSAAFVTMIILLSLASCCTALTVADFGTAIKSFGKSDKGLGVSNAAIGMYSRSLNVNCGMQQMRQEEQDEMSKSLKMSIAALTVIDIGGGVLLPVAQSLIKEIEQGGDEVIDAKKALTNFEFPESLQKFFNNPTNTRLQNGAKQFLIKRKNGIKTSLEVAMPTLAKKARSFARKLTKVKKIFKLKSIGKALGPVFDVINIGFCIDGLVSASKECIKTDSCNVGAIVSSSLGIVSSVLGIASLAFPVLAPFALIFGIASTLVELYWPTPINQLKKLYLEEEKYDLNAQSMMKMDTYSRRQLEGVTRFLRKSTQDDVYIYVVNQGHFPNWMEENIAIPEKLLSGPLTFGFNEFSQYNEYGVYNKKIEVSGQCTKVDEAFKDRSGESAAIGDTVCDYFQEGNGDVVSDKRFPGEEGKHYLGPDFYGISQGANSNPQHTKQGRKERKRDEVEETKSLGGVMVLVPTDRVTHRELVGQEGDKYYTTPVKIRGLHIDTEEKLRKNGVIPSGREYNDVVAIGDMHNLGYKVEDGGHMVIIDTGNSGNDVLIIDGWVKKLEAHLGANHNTLSFRTISISGQEARSTSEDKATKEIEIKGIKFNPGSGQLIMFGYDPDAVNNVVEHELGHVHGVGILGASPFHDEITLFALQEDPTNTKDDFTVFKYSGTATYIFDVKNYKSTSISRIVHFRIVDVSEICTAKSPLLKIINMKRGAEPQNVQHLNNNIHIRSQNGLLARISFVTNSTCTAKVTATTRRTAGGTKQEVFGVRPITDLDITEYLGLRFDHYFTRDIEADQLGNVMFVHCPKLAVHTNHTVIDVKTVIVTAAFFEGCDIRKNDDNPLDDREITVTVGQGQMWWTFPTDHAKIKATQEFRGAEEILNEYGAVVLALNQSGTFELFDNYLKTLGEGMVDASAGDVDEAVRNNFKMCILKKTNIEKLKKAKAAKPANKRDSEDDEDIAKQEFDITDIARDCADE